MLDGATVHNSAILKPTFIRCSFYAQYKSHAYAKDKTKNKHQCVECGIIREDYVHKHGASRATTSKGSNSIRGGFTNNPHTSNRYMDRQGAR